MKNYCVLIVGLLTLDYDFVADKSDRIFPLKTEDNK